MREIKFRAWDKETNGWLEGVTYTLHTSGQLITLPINVELMQYTGLKDCKGKEIYESDIIKCYDGITESYFNSAIEWQMRELTHEVATVPLEVSGFIIGSLSEVEIIGNIYENPELVKHDTQP